MMRSISEIKNEIEVVRAKLNQKIISNESRIPNAEVMELSKRMDELLNELSFVCS